VRVVAIALLLGAAGACTASAATPVRVAVAGRPAAPVAGRAWTVRLAVRPVSFRGTVRVTASGPKRISARASGRHGAYHASLVFPSAGRWTLSARAGGHTSRLGSVTVGPRPAQPVTFTEPTSIELEPAGTLLLVENNPGRLLRVDPATGRVTVLEAGLDHPYSVVRAPSGGILLTVGERLERLDAAGGLATVATMAHPIGPIAVAPGGDVYLTDGYGVFRLAGGAGEPARIAGGTEFFQAHGLAVAPDGAVLVGDTDGNRIARIDPATDAVTTLGLVGGPRGVDVAADGTVFAVDSGTGFVDRLSPSGASLGTLGPPFLEPYDLQAAPGGVVYLLESGPTGYIRRIGPDGKVTTVSRRAR
jgi:DNA-binding beta-propeller fold protein YncE